MGLRWKLPSVIAALALSALMVAPALAAAPTYSGTIWCTRNGEAVDMGPTGGAVSWTRKEINDYYRFYADANSCDNGSLDLSHMTQDP